MNAFSRVSSNYSKHSYKCISFSQQRVLNAFLKDSPFLYQMFQRFKKHCYFNHIKGDNVTGSLVYVFIMRLCIW